MSKTAGTGCLTMGAGNKPFGLECLPVRSKKEAMQTNSSRLPVPRIHIKNHTNIDGSFTSFMLFIAVIVWSAGKKRTLG